jgi:hypothetical protein
MCIKALCWGRCLYICIHALCLGSLYIRRETKAPSSTIVDLASFAGVWKWAALVSARHMSQLRLEKKILISLHDIRFMWSQLVQVPAGGTPAAKHQ